MTMNCEQARPLLSEHLDHELPSADAAQVGAHVLSCPDCGRAFDDLKKVGRAIRDLPLQPLPAGFIAKLERRHQGREPQPVPDFSAWLSPKPLAAFAAAAVCLLVVAGPWRGRKLAHAPGEALTDRELPSLKLMSEPPPPAPAASVPAAPPPAGVSVSGGQPFGEKPSMTNEQLQQELKAQSDKMGLEPYKEQPAAAEPFLGRRLGTASGRARGEAVVRSFAEMRQAVDEGAGKRSHAVEGSVAPVLGTSQRRGGGQLYDGAKMEDGYWSGEFAAGHEGNRTIETQQEWEAVWHALSTMPVPPIDFAKTQLLAVFLGPRPTGGYSIEFVETKRAARQLIVRWREHTPTPGITPPQAATAPYAIKAVPRVDVPVRFEKTR